jgi:exodeoxyribonuclease III
MSYYTVISWNVDIYNDEIHNYLASLINTNKPDVIFLSETKKKREDLIPYFNAFTEYNYIINSHNPARWHGVAMLIRKDHVYEQLQIAMNIPTRKDSHDKEAATGRVIAIRFNNQMNIIGSYTPNSGRSDPEKLNYRTKVWDPAFAYILEILRSQAPTLWMGDINVALNDIDVSNPKTMKNWAGFTPEERANLNILLCSGNWVDVWRRQNPEKVSYSWLGYPHRANYGMRLDNIIVSSSLLPYVINSFILSDGPNSSDHAPIGVYITK